MGCAFAARARLSADRFSREPGPPPSVPFFLDVFTPDTPSLPPLSGWRPTCGWWTAARRLGWCWQRTARCTSCTRTRATAWWETTSGGLRGRLGAAWWGLVDRWTLRLPASLNPPPFVRRSFFTPAGASWSRCWTGTRWIWWCRGTCTRTGELPRCTVAVPLPCLSSAELASWRTGIRRPPCSCRSCADAASLPPAPPQPHLQRAGRALRARRPRRHDPHHREPGRPSPPMASVLQRASQPQCSASGPLNTQCGVLPTTHTHTSHLPHQSSRLARSCAGGLRRSPAHRRGARPGGVAGVRGGTLRLRPGHRRLRLLAAV